MKAQLPPTARLCIAFVLIVLSGAASRDLAYDSIADPWNAVTQAGENPAVAITRPKDLTRLEERAYDRYCKGNSDPCKALKQATMQAIAMAEIEMQAMLYDPQGMLREAGQARWNNIATI